MGEMFALAAAVIWAMAIILLKKSGETVSPYALNLFRVTISSALFVLTLAAMRTRLWHEAPARDYLILLASGILGIALSDTFFHMGLNRAGAGITAIVGCLYSPTVGILAYFTLGERLGAWKLAGMALVIAGVLVASRHDPPPGTSRRRLLAGVFCGALAIVFVALAIVLVKPVLERSPVMWATATRQIGTMAVMLPAGAAARRRREFLAVFRPSHSWRFMLPATLLGSFLSLLCWIAGMKYTQAGSAAILNQTSTVFVLLFASLFLKEAFTGRKAMASALAVGGILMVTLG